MAREIAKAYEPQQIELELTESGMTYDRRRVFRARRAGLAHIPAGSWWPAIRVARPDPGPCPGGPLAAARRAGRHRWRRRR